MLIRFLLLQSAPGRETAASKSAGTWKTSNKHTHNRDKNMQCVSSLLPLLHDWQAIFEIKEDTPQRALLLQHHSFLHPQVLCLKMLMKTDVRSIRHPYFVNLVCCGNKTVVPIQLYSTSHTNK